MRKRCRGCVMSNTSGTPVGRSSGAEVNPVWLMAGAVWRVQAMQLDETRHTYWGNGNAISPDNEELMVSYSFEHQMLRQWDKVPP